MKLKDNEHLDPVALLQGKGFSRAHTKRSLNIFLFLSSRHLKALTFAQNYFI